MDIVPKIVLQNPYRILGVYANTAKKDIVANKGKATAFLKVNKPVEYPLDLKGILPAPNRTLNLMNEAEAHLAIAKEQIKYAQFWFLKMTPLDDIAFNHLLAGNMEGAIEIWSKQDSLSSLQNKMVCFLIGDKTRAAVLAAEKLYETYGDQYINKVDANCTLQMSGMELLHQFIDTLGEEVGLQAIIGCANGEEAKAYIRSQSIGPLINKISSEVEKTKKIDHKNAKARIVAARQLYSNTIDAFRQLKVILTIDDPQLQMIADKLGLEILQCGIDYFNNSEDEDAPHTAMKMQKYAQSIVMGSLARQRCDENVKILQKIIDDLPPKEVIASDKAIKKSLNKYVQLPANIGCAINLLNETKQHLQYIKVKLGNSDNYYLKMSTQIVALALHNIVEEVNAVQNDPQIAFRLQLGIGLDSVSLDKIKSTMREAWKATTMMDEFDLEAGFKSHYTQNRNTLKSMCNDLGISTYASRPTASSRPTTSTSTTRSTAQPRPSTAYSSSSSSTSSSSENDGCLLWVVAAFVVGAIGAAMTQSFIGFVVGVGIVGSIWGKIQ